MLPFKVALLNVAWVSPNSNQTRYFNSVSEQTNYFNNLAGSFYSEPVNIKVTNNVFMDITYLETFGRSLLEMLRCNYLIILDTNTNEYRYYFASVVQLSGDNYRVTIELDDIQTNYFKFKDTIEPCKIGRAHLNRFTKQTDGTYSFNNAEDSPLLISEGIDAPKRPIRRDRVKFKTKSIGSEVLDDWLYENVLCWVYIFVSSTHDFQFKDFKSTNSKLLIELAGASSGSDASYYDLGYGVFCYPIIKTANKLYWQGSGDKLEVCIDAWETFIKDPQNSSSHFFSIKFSQIPPFGYFHGAVLEGNNMVLSNGPVNGVQPKTVDPTDREDTCFFNPTFMTHTTLTSYTINLEDKGVKSNFTADEIRRWSELPLCNPKFISTEFLDINVCNTTGESFTYDMLKYGKTKDIELLHTEVVMTETTRQYTRFKYNGLYAPVTQEAFFGLVTQTDSSITIVTDAYQSYLASNKNFHAQAAFNMNMNMAKGVMNNLTIDPVKAAGAIGSLAMDTYSAQMTHEFATDNLKNSPDSIKAASGNIIFNAAVQQIGTYIEIKKALEIDTIELNNTMKQYGFKYGRLNTLGNVDNIRIGFNHVEAEIGTINAPISNIEKERLREQLKFITFFNNDNFNTEQINYERSIT